jgi:hypothetical protein
MIPLTMLSLLAGSGWKKLAMGLGALILVAVLVGLAGWRGYQAGYKAADLERRAEVAAIHESHAHALAEAESLARQQLEIAVVRAHDLEGQYLAARKTIEKQSRELTNQRIIHASEDVDTADGTCRFGPEWVCLYNEAFGARDRGDTVPAATSGPAGNAGAAQASQAGILSGVQTVNPEDILAHARDRGRYTRELEAHLSTLIEWAKGMTDGEVLP